MNREGIKREVSNDLLFVRYLCKCHFQKLFAVKASSAYYHRQGQIQLSPFCCRNVEDIFRNGEIEKGIFTLVWLDLKINFVVRNRTVNI